MLLALVLKGSAMDCSRLRPVLPLRVIRIEKGLPRKGIRESHRAGPVNVAQMNRVVESACWEVEGLVRRVVEGIQAKPGA